MDSLFRKLQKPTQIIKSTNAFIIRYQNEERSFCARSESSKDPARWSIATYFFLNERYQYEFGIELKLQQNVPSWSNAAVSWRAEEGTANNKQNG